MRCVTQKRLRKINSTACTRTSVSGLTRSVSDKDHIEERGAQVQIMDRVYREADHVISWVGDVAESSLEILIISSTLLFNKESDELRWGGHTTAVISSRSLRKVL
jgi:Heterokaryon incompatibility protein (HET)